MLQDGHLDSRRCGYRYRPTVVDAEVSRMACLSSIPLSSPVTFNVLYLLHVRRSNAPSEFEIEQSPVIQKPHRSSVPCESCTGVNGRRALL
jgi:hypothetical protein